MTPTSRHLLLATLLVTAIAVVAFFVGSSPESSALSKTEPGVEAQSEQAPALPSLPTVAVEAETSQRSTVPIEVANAAKKARVLQTLRGIVLDQEGGPVPHAKVRLIQFEDGVGRTVSSRTYRANQQGEFELQIKNEGAFGLLASHTSHGTGRIEVIQVGPENAPQDLRVTLSSGGAIGGRVLDPQGRGIPNYKVWVCPAEFSKPENSSLGNATRVALEFEGRGLAEGRATTDETGAFLCTGLLPGNYVVRGLSQSSWYFERLLTEVPVPCGSEALVLVLHRSTLIVRVVDAGGSALKVAGSFRNIQKGGADHALFFRECEADGSKASAWYSNNAQRTRRQDGSMLFDVRPGATYALGVVSQTAPLHEQLVTIPMSGGEQKLTIGLLPATEPGYLNVTLLSPTAEPFRGERKILIRGTLTSVILRESARDYYKQTFQAMLAPGTYRLRVDDTWSHGQHGGQHGEDRYVAVEQEVIIQPGQVTDVRIPLGAAGTLEVEATLVGEPDFERWPLKAIAVSEDKTQSIAWSLDLIRGSHDLVLIHLQSTVGGDALYP